LLAITAAHAVVPLTVRTSLAATLRTERLIDAVVDGGLIAARIVAAQVFSALFFSALIFAARRLCIAATLHRRRCLVARLGILAERRILAESRFARRALFHSRRNRRGHRRRRRRGGRFGSGLLRGSADAEPTGEVIPTGALRLFDRRGDGCRGRSDRRRSRFRLRGRTFGRLRVGSEIFGECVPGALLLFLIGHAYPFRSLFQ
jgi:hypothetical protein